jgi:predicted component of type VI protein secretion system
MSSPPDGTVPLRAAAEVRFRRIVVQVEEGDDMGKWAASGGEELAIGSAAGNDLVLTDTTVSRHHCSITARADGYVLRDLASMNGTFLGGFRIETAYLKHGASLRVGRTKLRFQQLEEEIREPLSEGDRFGSILGRSPAMRRICPSSRARRARSSSRGRPAPARVSSRARSTRRGRARSGPSW